MNVPQSTNYEKKGSLFYEMATVAVHILCILFLGIPHGGINVQCGLTIEYSDALTVLYKSKL